MPSEEVDHAIDGRNESLRLNRMPRTTDRSPVRIVALVIAMLIGFAHCADDESARRNDTVTVGGPPPDSVGPVPPPITWDTTAGLVFVVSAGAPGQAHLVDATYSERHRLDTLRIASARVDGLELELFAGGDTAGTARVAALGEVTGAQCVSWPVADLAPVNPGSVLRDWRVGFPRDRVMALGFDSLPALSSRDSASRTIAVARAASRVQGDTAVAFRGRPYVVRQANGVRLDGTLVILAEVVRTVQQEANPLHEQLVLVLERSAGADSAFVERYHERSIGPEEHAASIELIAGFRVTRTAVPALLLRRDSEEGMSFVLLERRASGAWYSRWTSALAAC